MVMAPKIPRWKLDTGQNRNCLTNCTAGSQEERSLRVEWLTRKGHVSKKPEVVRGRCTCSPSRRPFPPAVPSNKVLSQRNHVYEYVSRHLFLLLPPQNGRAAFSRVCKGSNATGIPFQKWAKYISFGQKGRMRFYLRRGCIAIVEVELIYPFSQRH